MAVNLRWPLRSVIKSTHSLVHYMFHLVWKFHEESSFSFWDLVRQLKKVDEKKIIIAKKEFQGNQESSPLLRWSLIILLPLQCAKINLQSIISLQWTFSHKRLKVWGGKCAHLPICAPTNPSRKIKVSSVITRLRNGVGRSLTVTVT